MLLRELFEGPDADAAFCFGRFNPAHQGHIEVWKAVQGAGHKWFVGTNPSTQGPNDPLRYEEKSAWMAAIYPAIKGHIMPEQSVLTLASKLYSMLGEGKTIAYVTDSNDWAWAGKVLNDYNGKQGPHGFYKFAKIKHVESPRVSSATALRTAARAGDESAFYAASGTDPELRVGGKTYFETVQAAVYANPEKVKKDNKKEKDKKDQKKDKEIMNLATLRAAAKNAKPVNDMNKEIAEFAPAGGDRPPRGPKTPGKDPWDSNDGPGDDPYSRPEPKYYNRSIDYFGRFEADHFDDEVFDKKTGVFKGYWDDEEGRVQIGYFKFDDPRKTGSDDPGMGWYYEPQ